MFKNLSLNRLCWICVCKCAFVPCVVSLRRNVDGNFPLGQQVSNRLSVLAAACFLAPRPRALLFHFCEFPRTGARNFPFKDIKCILFFLVLQFINTLSCLPACMRERRPRDLKTSPSIFFFGARAHVAFRLDWMCGARATEFGARKSGTLHSALHLAGIRIYFVLPLQWLCSSNGLSCRKLLNLTPSEVSSPMLYLLSSKRVEIFSYHNSI